MGKKTKRKGATVVVSSDLHTFNEQQSQKQKEQDLLIQQKEGKAVTVNRAEERFDKLQVADFSTHLFNQLDTKVIDYYFRSINSFIQEEKDVLEVEELLQYVRSLIRDTQYLLSLDFVAFWATTIKCPPVINFLDSFLLHFRKESDLTKLVVLDQMESQQTDDSIKVKTAVSTLMQNVLHIFFRLSLNQETSTDYFTPPFYCKLVYTNFVFDMAKFIDLSSIYGSKNHGVITQIISNVFEIEKRYLQDFKEMVDLVIGLIKRQCKEVLKCSEETQLQEQIVGSCIESFTTVEVIARCFPEEVIEVLKGTKILIFIANMYCFMRTTFRQWTKESPKYIEEQRKTLLKLIEKCMDLLLNRVFLPRINEHSDNYVFNQKLVAQSLSTFLLSATGNLEIAKDVLPKQINFFKAKPGLALIRHLLKSIDLRGTIDMIEDRFIEDHERNFIMTILESLSKGQQVMVRKITRPKADLTIKEAKLNLAEKENLNSLVQMFEGEHDRKVIEKIFLKNDKDQAKAVEDLLSGNIPNDIQNYQVVIKDNEEGKKEEEVIIQVDTSGGMKNTQPRHQVYNEFTQYLLEKPKTMSSRFYANHLKVLEQKQRDEENIVDDDYTKKVMYLAAQMQYEDDYDDTSLKNNKLHLQHLESFHKKKAQQEKDDEEDEEDDNNLEMIVERQQSEKDKDNAYLFEDDPVKKMREQRRQMERKEEEEKNDQRPARGRDQVRGGQDQRGRGYDKRGGNQNKDHEQREYDQRGRGGLRGNQQRGRGQDNQRRGDNRDQKDDSRGYNQRGSTRGGGRGRGFRDDYQQNDNKAVEDHHYTTENPIKENIENDYSKYKPLNKNDKPQEKVNTGLNTNSAPYKPQYVKKQVEQQQKEEINERDREADEVADTRGRGSSRGGNRGRGGRQNHKTDVHNQKASSQKKQGYYQ